MEKSEIIKAKDDHNHDEVVIILDMFSNQSWKAN